MKPARAESGFSMVEMLVVLAVISLVGIAGFNGFGFSQNAVSLKTISGKIQNIIALTSLRAVSNGNTASLTINVTEKIFSSDQHNFSIALPDTYILTVLTGHNLVKQDGVASIDFYSDGTSSGGRVTIEDKNGSKRSFSIFWLTGAVELEDWK